MNRCMGLNTAILLALMIAETGWAQGEIRLTIGAPDGVIRPLLGVNTGPRMLSRGGGERDFTEAFRQLGALQIRTHDFYGPLDMSTMYPDDRADPRRPTSFRFEDSDRFFDAIVQGGFEPYLRLGDSWNADERYPRVRRRSPAHPANWAEAAVAVVRHYEARSEGRLRYVEIWNEPDLRQFWDASPEEFFDLYARTAKAVKSAFPRLKVGGPAFAYAAYALPPHREMVRAFLEYQRRARAPLDFLSWHIYSNDPKEYAEAARFYRQSLDRHGFTEAESHVTEFHTDERRPVRGLPTIALRAGAPGAAILTGGWIALQRQNVAAAFVYRGADPDNAKPDFYGLLSGGEMSKKTALAFSLWGKMAECRERLAVSSSEGVGATFALAGRTADGEIRLLIANASDRPVRWRVAAPEGRRIAELSIEEVGERSAHIRRWRTTDAGTEAPPDSVQLVRLIRE